MDSMSFRMMEDITSKRREPHLDVPWLSSSGVSWVPPELKRDEPGSLLYTHDAHCDSSRVSQSWEGPVQHEAARVSRREDAPS
jgi:hypothetical protein